MSFVCPSWLSFILYNPIRTKFTNRQKVLGECSITEDSVVLEVGAGNGFFTEALAARAKKVIAIELQRGMVKKLTKRLGRLKDKVKIITGDVAAIGLDEHIADVCLLYYCFHEIRNKEEAAAVISRAVMPGGTLAIYEPTMEVSHKKMMETVSFFAVKGFSLEAESSGLFTRLALMRKVR